MREKIYNALVGGGLSDEISQEIAVKLATEARSIHEIDENMLRKFGGAKRGHIRLLVIARDKRGGGDLLISSDSGSDSGESWLESSQDGGSGGEEDTEDNELRRLIAEDEARVAAEERRFETGLDDFENDQQHKRDKVLEKSRWPQQPTHCTASHCSLSVAAMLPSLLVVKALLCGPNPNSRPFSLSGSSPPPMQC